MRIASTWSMMPVRRAVIAAPLSRFTLGATLNPLESGRAAIASLLVMHSYPDVTTRQRQALRAYQDYLDRNPDGAEVERVIELDRQQPEFTTTFSDYYRKRVTPARVEKGREMLQEHAELLGSISDRYGVPSHYLVSFWGLETNFGGYLGKMPIPDALATLACDERRSQFFTAELISAMRIIEAGDVSRESMTGSWAGAMGHVQFMPSTFLRYAVDGDGDGRRDLWGSLADVIGSVANYLHRHGWAYGQPVTSRARVADGADMERVSRRNLKPEATVAELGAAGFTPTDDVPEDLPAAVTRLREEDGDSYWLTYQNFYVITRYNRSPLYAMAVHDLAQAIAAEYAE